jgi:hypothetical protein
MFTPKNGTSANIWLDVNTIGNVIKLREGEKVIDEGEENTVTYS